jgi:hypothetical protein
MSWALVHDARQLSDASSVLVLALVWRYVWSSICVLRAVEAKKFEDVTLLYAEDSVLQSDKLCIFIS